MSIEIQNLSRDLRSTWALLEITAQISPGSTVGVLGANGAGKSTLLRRQHYQ
jgi:ABC-type multidrug transport system ATPase subunit